MSLVVLSTLQGSRALSPKVWCQLPPLTRCQALPSATQPCHPPLTLAPPSSSLTPSPRKGKACATAPQNTQTWTFSWCFLLHAPPEKTDNRQGPKAPAGSTPSICSSAAGEHQGAARPSPSAERDLPVLTTKSESHTEVAEPFNPTSAKLQLTQPPRKPDPTTSPTTRALGTGRFGGSLPSSGWWLGSWASSGPGSSVSWREAGLKKLESHSCI